MKRFALGRWVLVGYFLIGLLYAVYANNWGDEPYRSFAYHLGQGLVWPVMVLPGLGKFIGGLLIVAMVAFVMASLGREGVSAMAFLAQLILGGLMVYLFFASLGFWFGLGVIVLWLLIGMANSGKR